MYDYLIVGAGMNQSLPFLSLHVTTIRTDIWLEGPSGLCAAKTILQCEPLANIKILDSVSSYKDVTSQY